MMASQLIQMRDKRQVIIIGGFLIMKYNKVSKENICGTYKLIYH